MFETNYLTVNLHKSLSGQSICFHVSGQPKISEKTLAVDILSLSADETPTDCLDLNGHICPFHSALAKRPARPRRCLVDSLDMSHKTLGLFLWSFNLELGTKMISRVWVVTFFLWLGVDWWKIWCIKQVSIVFSGNVSLVIPDQPCHTSISISYIWVNHLHAGWDPTLATWIFAFEVHFAELFHGVRDIIILRSTRNKSVIWLTTDQCILYQNGGKSHFWDLWCLRI